MYHLSVKSVGYTDNARNRIWRHHQNRDPQLIFPWHLKKKIKFCAEEGGGTFSLQFFCFTHLIEAAPWSVYHCFVINIELDSKISNRTECQVSVRTTRLHAFILYLELPSSVAGVVAAHLSLPANPKLLLSASFLWNSDRRYKLDNINAWNARKRIHLLNMLQQISLVCLFDIDIPLLLQPSLFVVESYS